MEQPTPSKINEGRVALGVIFLTLGGLMLLNRADYFDFNAMLLFPGAFLVALGIIRMGVPHKYCERHVARSFVDGLWLITVGVWLIVNLLHLFNLTFETSWPLLLIAGGAFIVARALGR